ncbi:hypothetical protein PFUGPA_05104 [Plasmodium falciparum Palo Alto/Uganda]|uniref:Uncharacterized protein n=1 Tax=Plasmodium falciparum (isolate Palo Alto / Uganda) TaxID=57270 RepID=W4ITZ3_PLAFP|nr:hypothetical protein PFUGPA_05104 [Plasmodium falciparum Palo Alto/Uganda]
MSYNKTYGGQFMGIGAVAKKNNNTPTVAKREFNKVEKSAESKKADKVVISIVGVRNKYTRNNQWTNLLFMHSNIR